MKPNEITISAIIHYEYILFIVNSHQKHAHNPGTSLSLPEYQRLFQVDLVTGD